MGLLLHRDHRAWKYNISMDKFMVLVLLLAAPLTGWARAWNDSEVLNPQEAVWRAEEELVLLELFDMNMHLDMYRALAKNIDVFSAREQDRREFSLLLSQAEAAQSDLVAVGVLGPRPSADPRAPAHIYIYSSRIVSPEAVSAREEYAVRMTALAQSGTTLQLMQQLETQVRRDGANRLPADLRAASKEFAEHIDVFDGSALWARVRGYLRKAISVNGGKI